MGPLQIRRLIKAADDISKVKSIKENAIFMRFIEMGDDTEKKFTKGAVCAKIKQLAEGRKIEL